MKKAQIASQFLIITGFAMVIIVTFLIGFYSLSTDLRSEKQLVLIQDLALKIKEEVFLAYRVSDGYSRTFSLPQKLDGLDYNIYVVGSNTLLLDSEKVNYTTSIANFNGNLIKGTNLIIKNSSGVYIN